MINAINNQIVQQGNYVLAIGVLIALKSYQNHVTLKMIVQNVEDIITVSGNVLMSYVSMQLNQKYLRMVMVVRTIGLVKIINNILNLYLIKFKILNIKSNFNLRKMEIINESLFI